MSKRIGSRGNSPALDNLETDLRNFFGGVVRNRTVRLLAHRKKQLAIGCEPLNFARKVRTEIVIIVHDDCSSHTLEHLCVVKLLPIAMKRIRHKNRRTGGQ